MTRIAMLTATFLAAVLVFGQYLGPRNQNSHNQLHALSGSVHAGSAMDTQDSGNGITIDNFSFSPAALTIPAGTTVTWRNRDDIPHTVVQRDQKFKSKALDTDDTFSFTFTDPGTYEYFCSLHPKMVAKIVVEAKK
jgi:plastocyanin